MINFCLHSYKVPVSKYNVFLLLFFFFLADFLHFFHGRKQSHISVLQALSDISLTGMKQDGCTKLFDSLILFIHKRLTPKKQPSMWIFCDYMVDSGIIYFICYTGQSSLLSEDY